MRQNVSVVIVARNAGLHIGECVSAARSLTDNIIVVDTGSEDDTSEIATQMGAEVFYRTWQGYGATKNMAATLAKYDWILSLDADEILTEGLINQIIQTQADNQSVYKFKRVNFYGDYRVKFSKWNPDFVLRLFDRRTARWNQNLVHEKLESNPNVKIKTLEGELLHYSYENYAHRLEKVTNYARLSALDRFSKGQRSNLFIQLISPALKFLSTYVFYLGFMDGKAGLEIAWTDAIMVYKRSSELRHLQKISSTES